MERNQQNIRSLLLKYLDNKCTPEEMEELFAFIKEHPDDPLFEQSIEAEADSAINSTHQPLPEEISSSMLASLQSRLISKQTRRNTGFNSRTLLQLAAVFLMGFVCAGYFYFIADRSEIIEVKTQYGETKTITLPDQSVIMLNGNSSVSYESGLDESEVREVYLKGEAFFTVAHTANHRKFRVHSSNTSKIEVIGTEFTVNNRRNAVKVHLHTGKIRLDVQNDKKAPLSILMAPGEFIEVTPLNEVIRSQHNADISWTKNKFIFRDTRLSEILLLLEDNYGIVPVIKDSTFLQETFTATYPADLNILLKALSRSFDITVEESGTSKKIILGK